MKSYLLLLQCNPECFWTIDQMQGTLETHLCSYSRAPIWWAVTPEAGSWACGVCSHNRVSHLCVCVYVCVRLSMSNSFVTPSTVACQAPPSMGFSRQEYWRGLPLPSPGDLPNPGIEPTSPVSPALASVFFTTRATWWAAVHWVTQSRTWLKRLSSSSIPITIFVQVMNPIHNAQSNSYFYIFILHYSIIWQSWPLHPLSPYVILLLVFFLNSQDPLKLLRFVWWIFSLYPISNVWLPLDLVWGPLLSPGNVIQ